MENHINQVSTKYTNHLGDYVEKVAGMVYSHHAMMFSKIGAISKYQTGNDQTGVLEEKTSVPDEEFSPTSTTLFMSSIAWYKEGTFDLDRQIWPDAIGSNDAILSATGLSKLRKEGHGAVGEVVALQGTTSSKIDFGPIIKVNFSICSVTRYTGGEMKRILQGKEKNWLHGDLNGDTGKAYYDGWKTNTVKTVRVLNWGVMCGTNAGSQLKLSNGVDVGTDTGGHGNVTLQVNQGNYANQKSDFAIAEVVVWDRGLSKREMCEASGYLLKRYQYQPYNYGDLEVVNAESNIPKYLKYTSDWSQAQADCDKESTCVGYWEQMKTGLFYLLFPETNGRTWVSGRFPHWTVKLVMKKPDPVSIRKSHPPLATSEMAYPNSN